MHEAKPILIFVGAILAAVFPISRELATVYLRHLPRQYFSAVTLATKPVAFNRETGIGGPAMSSGGIDPEFLAEQIQMIKKSEILNPVIERLDLVKKLSPPGMTMPMQWVTEVLSRSIVVQEQRNTSLIEIGVYHADKHLAADIANTVAVCYRDKRIEDMKKNMIMMLAEMKDQVIATRKRAELARFDPPSSQLPVEILQRAQPAQVPARPDTVHILRCVNVIGGSLGAIGVLLILFGAGIPSRIFSRAEVQE